MLKIISPKGISKYTVSHHQPPAEELRTALNGLATIFTSANNNESTWHWWPLQVFKLALYQTTYTYHISDWTPPFIPSIIGRLSLLESASSSETIYSSGAGPPQSSSSHFFPCLIQVLYLTHRPYTKRMMEAQQILYIQLWIMFLSLVLIYCQVRTAGTAADRITNALDYW